MAIKNQIQTKERKKDFERFEQEIEKKNSF